LSQALNGINLETVSVSEDQKEVIRNIVVLTKDINFFTCFGKSLIFQLLAFVFDSLKYARSDREAKRFAGQLSNGSEY